MKSNSIDNKSIIISWHDMHVIKQFILTLLLIRIDHSDGMQHHANLSVDISCRSCFAISTYPWYSVNN